MKTSQEYVKSIKELKSKVYFMGREIKEITANPCMVAAMNAVAVTYSLAHEPQYEHLMTATSHLSGKKVNRFTHIHQNTDDLIKKVKMLRLLGKKTGTCFQRCVGMDALNALYSTTFEIDEKYRTSYHEVFKNFLRKVQDDDLVVDGAMTDPKGNRGLRPSQQEDPDLYLRIISKNKDGIYVKGAKCHQTGAVNSHEILVMPTISMREEDKDYAVSFAIPRDTEGIIYVYGRQASDTRRMEGGTIDVGNAKFGGQEALVIFDNVFVPWERVFMCGEYDFSGMLVERFAAFHRQSYGGCKVGVGDVLIGAAATLADYHGIAKASHIKDKIVEMIHLNETLYSCGIACSYEGLPNKAGSFNVDTMLANVCKLNVTRFPYEICRMAEDIAGGLLVTLPSEKDVKHPEIEHLINKYLQGAAGIKTECRLRMLRLVENLTLGSGAVGYRTESLHGAGSPEAMRIMIARQSNLEEKKDCAKRLAGITEE